jgi:hypothetical protein
MKYQNEMRGDLSVLEKLQLRIAKERRLEVRNLKGEEFKRIKQFMHLEERQ